MSFYSIPAPTLIFILQKFRFQYKFYELSFTMKEKKSFYPKNNFTLKKFFIITLLTLPVPCEYFYSFPSYSYFEAINKFFHSCFHPIDDDVKIVFCVRKKFPFRINSPKEKRWAEKGWRMSRATCVALHVKDDRHSCHELCPHILFRYTAKCMFILVSSTIANSMFIVA